MYKYVLIGLVVLLSTGCTSEPEAVRALDGAGYTDVRITGWKPLKCDDRDTFSTGFVAVGPTGKNVSGSVCSGFLKGATIRLD